MPMISSWADIEDLGGEDWLLPGEKKLREACRTGELCVFAFKRPETSAEKAACEIRADLLRYFILGGCPENPVNGAGVRLIGAYISGELDASFAACKGETSLMYCDFENSVTLRQTHCTSLYLNHGKLPALNARGLRTDSDVFLRNLIAVGEVDISDARIGGLFVADSAYLTNPQGKALNVQGLEAKGSGFIDDLTASGEVSFSGAKLGGQFSANNATLNNPQGDALNAQNLEASDIFLKQVKTKGAVDLIGAAVSGNLELNDAQFDCDSFALRLDNAEIGAGLFWRRVHIKNGIVSLNNSHVSAIYDDLDERPDAWPGRSQLDLDGFTYDRISEGGTDPNLRLEWIKDGTALGEEFTPQPYTQLAKVLRESGHDSGAQEVLTRREHYRHKQRRDDRVIEPDGTWSKAFVSLWRDATNLVDWTFLEIFRRVAGYGHKPFRSLWWLLFLWSAAVWLSHEAWENGDFAPASGALQATAEWRDIAASDAENPARVWSTKQKNKETGELEYSPGQDWETFNRYSYAADLVIPIINLGQTDTWSPSTERGDSGRRLYAWGFVLQICGWIVTALGAAAITGLIRRE